ncbi:D-isomer specific 2-hydroxyacid dehydrogenase [Hysterangium stoloniferum]|nr:D-isomer specific 2-hydroxyacid dehydrogenase [Hysterangium stoloniferum]
MSLRVAILDDYQGVALTSADWSAVQAKAQVDVFRDTISGEAELVKRLEPYAVVCTMRERTKITASLLDKLPNLKLITTTGMANRSIDLKATAAKDITVVGSGGKGNSTLEHIWALILAVTRRVVVEDANIKTGKPQWQSEVPTGLSGKTLSLLGVGRFGSQVAQIAKLFGMRVLAWSPNLTPERAEKAGVEFAPTKEELLKQADLFSIHMVLAPSTRHLIGAADLALLKPTAFLFNTSRGPIIEENALIEALSAKKFAGAGLDVYDIEPLPLDHPLRKVPNVTLSPHNAYVNEDNYKCWWEDTAQSVTNFVEGKDPKSELVIG